MSIDFFGRKLNTYRANLHTHSTLSDGEFTPDQVTDLYSKAGYDVMCFTDHRKNSRISEIDPRGMLLLPGAELHPTGGRITISHLLCVNLPEDFDVSIAERGKPGENHMQPTIDAVNAAGGLCFCAHPYWCGFRAEEIAALRGLAGIEVYNTSTRYIGKAYNMHIWDVLGGNDRDAIGTGNLVQSSGDGFGQVAVVEFLDQVRDNFAVRVGRELVPGGFEAFPQIGVVFDDAVVDDGELAFFVGMRVGIAFAGDAVRGPAGVGDAGVHVLDRKSTRLNSSH